MLVPLKVLDGYILKKNLPKGDLRWIFNNHSERRISQEVTTHNQNKCLTEFETHEN